MKIPAGNGRARLPAFTLIEVMVAVAIFFMAAFAILELVSQNLKMARSLSRNVPHAGMLAAEQSLTNKLEEGSVNGDFGELYPGFSWTRETLLASTNGLFQVNYAIYHGGAPHSQMSILLYRPDSVVNAGAGSLKTRQ